MIFATLLLCSCAGLLDFDDEDTTEKLEEDSDTPDLDPPVGASDAEEACLRYVEAVNACSMAYATAAGVDPSTVRVERSYCDAYEGLHDRETARYLDCLTEAYDAIDCSTVEGYASLDITDCTPG